MGCLKLPYYEKDDRPNFLGLWKKSDGSKNCDNYYPFGLTFNSYSRENSLQNKFLFNGGSELQTDLNLGIYFAFFRTYDPAIGRFMQTDELADFFPGINPYSFGLDNPISYGDPDGLGPIKDFFQRLFNPKIKFERRSVNGKRVQVAVGRKPPKSRPNNGPRKSIIPDDHPAEDDRTISDDYIRPWPPINLVDVNGVKPLNRHLILGRPNSLDEDRTAKRNDQSIPPGTAITFTENIQFFGNSDRFYDTPQNQKVLSDLAKTLKDYPQLQLLILGNSGTTGSYLKYYGNTKDAFNQPAPLNGQNSTLGGLMTARAKAIYQALKNAGIDPNRLIYAPGNIYKNGAGVNTSFVLRNPN